MISRTRVKPAGMGLRRCPVTTAPTYKSTFGFHPILVTCEGHVDGVAVSARLNRRIL